MVMVDLTQAEIRTLLWHVNAVSLAYGDEPPESCVIASATDKLQAELSRLIQGSGTDDYSSAGRQAS